jgi:hypothetical protein
MPRVPDRRLKQLSAALSTVAGCHSLCLLSLGQARESKSPSGRKATYGIGTKKRHLTNKVAFHKTLTIKSPTISSKD